VPPHAPLELEVQSGEGVPARRVTLAPRADAPAGTPADEPLTASLRDDGVGVLGLRRFSFGLSSLVAQAMARLERRGMQALVIDLRDNPGGDAREALRLADDFLPQGAPLAVRVEGDGERELLLARGASCYPLPVTLLVNHGTASAAELFAGALQANGRATLVGERTYGKGVAHTLDARGASAGWRQAGEYLLPDGRPISGVGLCPSPIPSRNDA
jgi:carboxyl-terminal processing protease